MNASGESLRVLSHIPGSGFGDAASQYCLALGSLGVPVSWWPFQANPKERLAAKRVLPLVPLDGREELAIALGRRSDCQVDLVSRPLGDSIFAGPPAGTRRNYAYVAWELEDIKPEWATQLNGFDGVMVPSEFNRRALLEGGVNVPLTVIPHIARPPGGGDIIALDIPVSEDDYLFYTIGSWTQRKGMEETLRAYLSAFEAGDPVVLVVLTNAIDAMAAYANPRAPGRLNSVAYQVARILADYPRAPRVHLVIGPQSPEWVDALHRRADCFVSLTRSEGWGLGAFDALVNGKPAIITGFGGQRDYLGDDYSLAVDYRRQPVGEVPPDGSYVGMEASLWAEPDAAQAVELMRAVFESREQWRCFARDIAARLQQQFAAERVAAELGRALELIH